MLRRRWSIARCTYLSLEFTLLFVAVPVLFLHGWMSLPLPAHRAGGWTVVWRPLPMLPTLWLFAAGCLAVLLADRRFARARLGNTRDFAARCRRVARLAPIGATVLFTLAWWLQPDHVLGFVRRRPDIWLLVMLLYPLLSVYPQEIIYRAFLFHRYRPLFGRGWAMVLASAAAFGWLHIIFDPSDAPLLHRAVAPGLSFIGGLLFARTYARTKSLLVTSVEHAIYGDLLFTAGLGMYFFGASFRWRA